MLKFHYCNVSVSRVACCIFNTKEKAGTIRGANISQRPAKKLALYKFYSFLSHILLPINSLSLNCGNICLGCKECVIKLLTSQSKELSGEELPECKFIFNLNVQRNKVERENSVGLLPPTKIMATTSWKML